MDDFEELAWTPLEQPPTPHPPRRRWLLIGSLALAFMLALGIGTVMVMGASSGTAQAAALSQGSTGGSQTLVVDQSNSNGPQATGAQGQCEALTVSSVSGNTIVGKTSSGSTVTIHTTASTRYTQAGKTVAASAITAGTRISVMGTHNSDGSITATSIDIGR